MLVMLLLSETANQWTECCKNRENNNAFIDSPFHAYDQADIPLEL